jgi:hypothetical protein
VSNEDELRARINLETGRLAWPALARHFARGSLVRVDPALDLVAVAAAFSRDDRDQVEPWTVAGEVAPANDEDAVLWHREETEFWTVVVAPWVLVQPISDPHN